jgi:hypothetical protein
MNIPDQPIAMSHESTPTPSSAADSPRSADSTSRMGPAKWQPPVCDSYQARLMELLDPLTRRGSTEYSA